MLTIECEGTPYEIGHRHGAGAAEAIGRSITFYANLFEKTGGRDWPAVLETARPFAKNIESKWPRYYEEMKGVADGAHRDIMDIVALNVRTEIAYGMFSDGCTSAYSRTSDGKVLQGQNWDWSPAQRQNLVNLKIRPSSISTLPALDIITEAGLIGKIGLNSSGVGVCFNALKALGADPSRLPAHLALRHALEHTSAESAAASVEANGVASACYMLVGDVGGAIGLECSSKSVVRQPMSRDGVIVHANHYVCDHGGRVTEAVGKPQPGAMAGPFVDSRDRMPRLEELVRKAREEGTDKAAVDGFAACFEDEQSYPASICRQQLPGSEGETLFNIVMELEQRRARVRVGRPIKPEETLELGF